MANARQNDIVLGKVVERDPDIHSGDLVFTGTRVPVDSLVGYLKGGHSIEDFLQDYPTVETLAVGVVSGTFAPWTGLLESAG